MSPVPPVSSIVARSAAHFGSGSPVEDGGHSHSTYPMSLTDRVHHASIRLMVNRLPPSYVGSRTSKSFAVSPSATKCRSSPELVRSATFPLALLTSVALPCGVSFLIYSPLDSM